MVLQPCVPLSGSFPKDQLRPFSRILHDAALGSFPKHARTVATNTGAHISSSGIARSPGVVVYEVLEPIPAGLKRADFMRLLQERIETASKALLTNPT